MRKVLAVLLLPLAIAASAPPSERDSYPPKLEKVIGGQKANPAEWPFIAGILKVDGAGKAMHCGGALIAPQWVLSASHCFVLRDGSRLGPNEIEIVIGAGRIDDPKARRVKAAQVITHPGFNHAQMINDIALVKLEAPVSAPTLPISLARTTDPTGGLLGVAGYGSVREDQDLSWKDSQNGQKIGLLAEGLLKTALPLQSTTECARRYAALTDVEGAAELKITPAHLCAGYEKAAKDTCQGDSGGPLLAYDGAGRSLGVGIVSYGYGCARPGMFGVYTRVSAHAAWLRQYLPGFAGAQWARSPTFVATRPEGLDQALERLAPAKGRVHLAPCRIRRDGPVDCTPGALIVGDRLQFEITSSVAGTLIFLDVDPENFVTQIFPQPGAPIADSWIEADKTRVFTQAGVNLDFAAVPPCGKGRFLAIVAPPTADLSAFTRGRGAATKGIGVAPALDGPMSDRTYAAEFANEIVRAAEQGDQSLPGWGWVDIQTDVRPSPDDPTCSGRP